VERTSLLTLKLGPAPDDGSTQIRPGTDWKWYLQVVEMVANQMVRGAEVVQQCDLKLVDDHFERMGSNEYLEAEGAGIRDPAAGQPGS
jgi:hypothetical protein